MIELMPNLDFMTMTCIYTLSHKRMISCAKNESAEKGWMDRVIEKQMSVHTEDLQLRKKLYIRRKVDRQESITESLKGSHVKRSALISMLMYFFTRVVK